MSLSEKDAQLILSLRRIRHDLHAELASWYNPRTTTYASDWQDISSQHVNNARLILMRLETRRAITEPGPLQLCESRARALSSTYTYYADWAARIRNTATLLRGLAMQLIDGVCSGYEYKWEGVRQSLMRFQVGRPGGREPARSEAFVRELYCELVGFEEVFMALTGRWLVICDSSRGGK
ncbi:hypothetical protein H2198_005782 [Neophaeococcomyces mojaviensis]|uniref:Uncharacterized protein n=1 Tax=Neophaeococcomyces mojaviensis TaxID=3383035 RepID=A0ACC3A4N8_9EURO|nr:hypothetical protein H2198_005782 [Knufia sp. JES_112]